MLKFLSADIKTKIENENNKTNKNNKTKIKGKYDTYHLLWTTIPKMDRQKIPILTLIRHVKPANE